jgi:TorA maturation chaperone TorD
MHRSAPSPTCGSPAPLLPEEDQARADMYALLSHLLLAPPGSELLTSLAEHHEAATGLHAGHLEIALNQLCAAARAFDPAAVREEFDALFTSTGTPLLNPYGSRYLCGFLMDTPLAALREDLARLGLGRRDGAWETEDHLGLLCETMRILIEGDPPYLPQSLDVQRAFYERHIAPWVARCLEDIAQAAPANFYRVLAGCAAAFFAVETEGFSFLPSASGDAGNAAAASLSFA